MTNEIKGTPTEYPVTIAGIVDGEGAYIKRSGYTYSSKVVVIGTAAPDTTVTLYNDTSNLGIVPVDAYGGWFWESSGIQTQVTYSLYAKSTSGDNAESKTYGFTRGDNGPPTKKTL